MLLSLPKVEIRRMVSDDLALLWDWLQESPDANFNDYSPRTFDGFVADIARRSTTQNFTMALQDGKPCGAIGFQAMTPRTGMTSGICFSMAVHGTGVAKQAVRLALQDVFDRGMEKVSASFFADNERIGRFLAGFGAVEEGYLKAQTVRGGKLVDMRLVAIFRDVFTARFLEFASKA